MSYNKSKQKPNKTTIQKDTSGMVICDPASTVEEVQFRCIALKCGRQHVSTHGHTVMEQPVARDLFQSLAAGFMLVEPQHSSDNGAVVEHV